MALYHTQKNENETPYWTSPQISSMPSYPSRSDLLAESVRVRSSWLSSDFKDSCRCSADTMADLTATAASERKLNKRASIARRSPRRCSPGRPVGFVCTLAAQLWQIKSQDWVSSLTACHSSANRPHVFPGPSSPSHLPSPCSFPGLTTLDGGLLF